MATKAEAEALAALAADTDAFEALRDRAAGMVNQMMDQAERILEVGTPADKAQFTKTVLPAILKSLQEKKEGDDLAELRQAQADLMSEVREALVGGQGQPSAPVVPDVPEDGVDQGEGRRTVAKRPTVKRPPRSAPRNSTKK